MLPLVLKFHKRQNAARLHFLTNFVKFSLAILLNQTGKMILTSESAFVCFSLALLSYQLIDAITQPTHTVIQCVTYSGIAVIISVLNITLSLGIFEETLSDVLMFMVPITIS